jgi:hypothetical protein
MEESADIQIWDFEFDHGNVRHFSRGLSPEKVWEVWSDQPVILVNYQGRTASHLMVGIDNSTVLWTIAMLRVDAKNHVWRPISGWPTEQERERRAWLGEE